MPSGMSLSWQITGRPGFPRLSGPYGTDMSRPARCAGLPAELFLVQELVVECIYNALLLKNIPPGGGQVTRAPRIVV